MENFCSKCGVPEYGMTDREQAMLEEQKDPSNCCFRATTFTNMIRSYLSATELTEAEGDNDRNIEVEAKYSSTPRNIISSPSSELVEEEIEFNYRCRILSTGEWIDAEGVLHSRPPSPPDYDLIGQGSVVEALNILQRISEQSLEDNDHIVEVIAKYDSLQGIGRVSPSPEPVDGEIESIVDGEFCRPANGPPSPPDSDHTGQGSEMEALNILLPCREVCCRPPYSPYSYISDKSFDFEDNNRDVEVETKSLQGIGRVSLSPELVEGEIGFNCRCRILSTGEWVDAEGVIHSRPPSPPEYDLPGQGSEMEAFNILLPCREDCYRPSYSPYSDNSEQSFDSPSHEMFSTPIKTSTPIILKEYVSTPTSTIRGLRRRRLNFSVDEDEYESGSNDP
ncbi:unnamed protein product [Ceratitis capitata]|uniref:(Mediterranean fruit fly) hypothetical protein n=1 Tax=Ceratitis capitata TaxID=7213 RepID=A0A811V8R6_CERCA|nr:unnamed protein product [Ceratitis capitata]